MIIIAPIFIGFLFGFFLHKGGMTRYHKIVNVFRFTDMAVLKFMMTSMVVGMIGIYFLVNTGLVPNMPITATHVVRNLIGGLLFDAAHEVTRINVFGELEDEAGILEDFTRTMEERQPTLVTFNGRGFDIL